MPNMKHDITWSRKTPVEITPDKAKKCMDAYYAALKTDTSKRNRTINHNRVFDYANDMKAGKWAVNGETIKFDEDGIIVDGQHRMMACIKSGVPFKTMVTYNVPRDTFDTIDVGNLRTANQTLRMLSVSYSSNVAAVINGINNFMEHMPDGGIYASKTRMKPHQLRETYYSNKEGFDDAAEFASKYNRTGVLTQKLIGTLYYYLIFIKHQDADVVRTFLIDITLDDSVPNALENNLRKKLFALKGWPHSYERVRLSMIVKTWNALSAGLTKVKLPNCDAPKSLNLNPEVPQFESRT